MWAKLKRIRWLWWPDTYAIALGAIIVIGSLIPPHSNAPLPEHFYQRGDVYQHVGAYALLTFFALLSWGEPRRRISLIMMAIICLGAGLEVMQLFVGRSFDAVDLATNCAGVMAGGLVFLGWRRRKAVAA